MLVGKTSLSHAGSPCCLRSLQNHAFAPQLGSLLNLICRLTQEFWLGIASGELLPDW